MDHDRNINMLLTIAEAHISADGFKDLEKSGAEAIRAIDRNSRLLGEIQKMEKEVSRCHEIAANNAIYGMRKEEAIWNARGQAFRDCIDIIKKCLGGA